jgi:NitT/TauT family transport system permease protein
MKPATLIRSALILAAIAALEIACRLGWVTPLTIVPPSRMATGLLEVLADPEIAGEVLLTLRDIAAAAASSIVAGFAAGALLHAWPRARGALDPLLTSYYAVPVFVFYPVFIVLFGFNRLPVIAVGFLFAVMAMITSTLTGLDRVPRVLRKVARTLHLGPLRTVLLVTMPAAAPQFIAGMKFAIAYSFVAVLGAEFIMASAGIGYRISLSFSNFDNAQMYALILLVLILITLINAVLFALERRVLRRRGLA